MSLKLGVRVMLFSLALFPQTRAVAQTQWQLDGVPVATGPARQEEQTMVSDGNGGAIVVWVVRHVPPETDDVYAQRLNGDGTTMWTENGILICTTHAHAASPVEK